MSQRWLTSLRVAFWAMWNQYQSWMQNLPIPWHPNLASVPFPRTGLTPFCAHTEREVTGARLVAETPPMCACRGILGHHHSRVTQELCSITLLFLGTTRIYPNAVSRCFITETAESSACSSTGEPLMVYYLLDWKLAQQGNWVSITVLSDPTTWLLTPSGSLLINYCHVKWQIMDEGRYYSSLLSSESQWTFNRKYIFILCVYIQGW